MMPENLELPNKRTVTYINGRKIILDENGKPCRSCNSLLDFQFANLKMNPKKASENMTNDKMVKGFEIASGTVGSTLAASVVAPAKPEVPAVSATPATIESDIWPPPDCPPDSQQLGRSTWTLLHTMAANYPDKASFAEQAEMTSFLHLFSKVYPCWYCAKDFRKWLDDPINKPKVSGKEEFSLWLCKAHNQVNQKLGKDQFKCVDWRQRWLDGWNDGRCD